MTLPPLQSSTEFKIIATDEHDLSISFDVIQWCGYLGVAASTFFVAWMADRFPHALKDLLLGTILLWGIGGLALYALVNRRTRGALKIGSDGILITAKTTRFLLWNQVAAIRSTEWQHPLGIYDAEVLCIELNSGELLRLEVKDVTHEFAPRTTLQECQEALEERKAQAQAWQQLSRTFKPTGSDYRSAPKTEAAFHVRVCLDPEQEDTAKQDAFSRLDAQTQEELIASLVEPQTLKLEH